MAATQAFAQDDETIASAVATLVDAERDIARIEATKVVQFAMAMRVALQRGAHRPRSVQEREMALRSIAAEIAVALRWNDRTVQQRLGDALTMVEAFPRTLDALAAGTISARHAHAIVDIGATLADPTARAADETAVLDRALTETVARTTAFARIVAEDLHPEPSAERCAAATRRRRVWIEEDVDGLARLGVLDDAVKIRAMFDRLTQQARAIRSVVPVASGDRDVAHAERPEDDSPAGTVAGGEGTRDGVVLGDHRGEDDDAATVRDRRTIDQVRADLVCDLVLTGQPAIDPTSDVLPGGLGAIRAQVSVTVPVLTAAGISDRGAVVDGAGLVDPETARRLMATAPGWDRILIHPVSGAVLAVDRYRPTAAMQRFLSARDVHCRFPGCRQPARRCDVDHNEEFARGGPTRVGNLASLCKRHHTLKTETPWRAEQVSDGSIRWTSPLGRSVVDRPHAYVRFVPVDDEPPQFSVAGGAPPF